MRAIATRPSRPGTAEVIAVERPTLAPNEVTIAMRAAGLGLPDHGTRVALIMGHESLGQVAEGGREVSGFAERLITRRVPFERYREAFEERDEDIEVLIEVGT